MRQALGKWEALACGLRDAPAPLYYSLLTAAQEGLTYWPTARELLVLAAQAVCAAKMPTELRRWGMCFAYYKEAKLLVFRPSLIIWS